MMPEKDDTHAVASHCDVKVTLEGGWTRPRMNEPEPFALRVEVRFNPLRKYKTALADEKNRVQMWTMSRRQQCF